MAVNPSTNRIYVANAGSDSVSVIDGASNTVAATVAVGSNPLGVAVNPNTNRIYVANSRDDTVSVIEDYPIPQPAACCRADIDALQDHTGRRARASEIAASLRPFATLGVGVVCRRRRRAS